MHARPQPPRGYVSPAASTGGIGAYPQVSARAAYPTFLSPQEAAALQLKAAAMGLFDAFRWDAVVRLVASDAEVRSNIFKSLILNAIALLSIYVFDLLLLPLAQEPQHWLHRNVGWFYSVLWLGPVVGVSLYLNSTWCSLLAKRTFTLRHGSRATAPPPSTYTGLLESIATSAYRLVMVFTSVVVSVSLRFVPYIGPTVGFVFMCWVDAYYCFEFIWIARGHSLSKRLRYLEERWAYYFAFGLPATALCMWGSALANAAIFALVFPAYIIMAMHARPIPLDPYNPSGEEVLRHPSPFIPIRIPVFTVVVRLNDIIVYTINFVSLLGGSARTVTNMPQVRHRRAPSDSVESVEEGEAIPLQEKVSPPVSSMSGSDRKPKPPRLRETRGTVGLDRRKFD